MRGATTLGKLEKLAPGFQSTLLMRGATTQGLLVVKCSLFQSTLLMRGATNGKDFFELPDTISIHAPHARSDFTARAVVSCSMISIHAPHARSDFSALPVPLAHIKFQSTLLMRGATLPPENDTMTFSFQSTLLMRGATRADCVLPVGLSISIHAPHARSDEDDPELAAWQNISIHAPHARSDSVTFKH